MLAMCEEDLQSTALFHKWSVKSKKKNWVGPFIITFPAALESSIDLLTHFYAHPEKRFKEGGGIEDVPENILIKFKISKVSESEALQVSAPSKHQGGSSWFHLYVSSKALITPGPCKYGIGQAMRAAGFRDFKMDFVKAKFKTGTDTLHVKIKHVPEVFDFSVPIAYWIKTSEDGFEAHKADIGRLAPDLYKECNLKPCKHNLTLKCLCHLAPTPRKPQERKKATNGQSDQLDFLRAQRLLQQQEESEEEAAEDHTAAPNDTTMILSR